MDTPTIMSAVESAALSTDTLWVLISAALVFFMQAGFLAYETGCVRPKNKPSVAVKNVIDWMVISVVFFVIGAGVMFGRSDHGFFGMSLFFLEGLDAEGTSPLGFTFILFQLAFCATAATIVSGATSERTGLIAYLVASVFIGVLIYPVFGYWTWGSGYFADNTPWLADLGFMDFAGSTVVHSVGGWVALIGAWFIGPRLGRFDADGNVQDMERSSTPLMALGLFILMFGWIGFNGGSQLAFDTQVGIIVVNTLLCGGAAGISALLHCYFAQGRIAIYEKLMGGVLGGLVAITACCNVVTPMGALAIGLLTGVIHNVAAAFLLEKLKIDDPVGAVPVHLVCGIWGTLCVALFGQQELLALPRLEQLGVQVVGITACAFWSVLTSLIMYAGLRKFVGLRVSPLEEKEGICLERRYSTKLHKNSDTDKDDDWMSEDELIKMMGA